MGQTVNTGSTVTRMLNNQLPIIQMQIRNQSWLFVGNQKPEELRKLIKTSNLPRPQVLWCPTKSLKVLVPAIQPQVAIAPDAKLETKDLSILNQSKTQLLFTGRDGAIQWTPQRKFETFVRNMEDITSVL